MDWIHPHSWVYVTGPDGNVTTLRMVCTGTVGGEIQSSRAKEISVEGFMAYINMRRQRGSSFPWGAEWALEVP
jgi:hypothetical protein